MNFSSTILSKASTTQSTERLITSTLNTKKPRSETSSTLSKKLSRITRSNLSQPRSLWWRLSLKVTRITPRKKLISELGYWILKSTCRIVLPRHRPYSLPKDTRPQCSSHTTRIRKLKLQQYEYRNSKESGRPTSSRKRSVSSWRRWISTWRQHISTWRSLPSGSIMAQSQSVRLKRRRKGPAQRNNQTAWAILEAANPLTETERLGVAASVTKMARISMPWGKSSHSLLSTWSTYSFRNNTVIVATLSLTSKWNYLQSTVRWTAQACGSSWESSNLASLIAVRSLRTLFW